MLDDPSSPTGADADKAPPRQVGVVNVECVFFGPLREPVGAKRVTVDVESEATIADLLATLAAEYDGVTFFDDDGLRDDRTVTLDRKDVRHLDGVETHLSEGDVVRVTTAVYGGRE